MRVTPGSTSGDCPDILILIVRLPNQGKGGSRV